MAILNYNINLKDSGSSGGGSCDCVCPAPATALPLSCTDTGAVGVSTKYAREDHIHPCNLTPEQMAVINQIPYSSGVGGTINIDFSQLASSLNNFIDFVKLGHDFNMGTPSFLTPFTKTIQDASQDPSFVIFGSVTTVGTYPNIRIVPMTVSPSQVGKFVSPFLDASQIQVSQLKGSMNNSQALNIPIDLLGGGTLGSFAASNIGSQIASLIDASKIDASKIYASNLSKYGLLSALSYGGSKILGSDIDASTISASVINTNYLPSAIATDLQVNNNCFVIGGSYVNTAGSYGFGFKNTSGSILASFLGSLIEASKINSLYLPDFSGTVSGNTQIVIGGSQIGSKLYTMTLADLKNALNSLP